MVIKELEIPDDMDICAFAPPRILIIEFEFIDFLFRCVFHANWNIGPVCGKDHSEV